ncbi:hypothetical protein D187_001080 [Cystobacter fuscus DSM 2262]|uniref:Photosynthesis system II assembly factor Ycf48/Hcf136-like domain-containing protein n=1 Tax=Cystobacter fuscus (strain ATCC 25194 / DSM 2262 / NBRC 100088 / M29) TaxID=1242864 RepID=S9PFX0_CYSF2|nr:hypothetical protein [Cystobacter fuscus]EPX61297.1 hypothetical protein D187_001080 [Cystobacter fuscus DSM 2262]
MHLGSWMPIVSAALLLVLPASAQVPPPPLPSVDLAVHELRLQAGLLSKRTEEDLWVLDDARFAVQVSRSADAGRSWRVDAQATEALVKALLAHSHNTLEHMVWPGPDTGIAAGAIGPRVLRTTDAGRSWKSIPLTDDLQVHDLQHLGDRLWLCGSSGRIFRSDDAGASWRELKGTPFNDDDRCLSMSFLSPESGWALGSKESLWSTEDGGTSWQRLPLGDLTRTERLRRVVRLSRHVAWLQGEGLWVQGESGWVQGESRRFVTTDGGKTWQSKASEEKDPLLSVARTPDGQRIITVRPTGDGVPLEQWIPFLGEEKAVVLGADTVVALGKRRLYTFISGQLLRAGPPVSQGSGVLTPLEGIARKAPDEWLGWAGDQIVASHDEGRSWFQVGRVPQSPLRAIAFLKTKTVLAELGTGALLRSEDFGRTWKTSTSPLDAYDFARASGRTTTPDNPFECVLGTSPVSMKIHYEESGCFNVFGGVLSVRLSPGEALLSVERNQGGAEGKQVRERRKLSRGDGERIIRELVAAAIREETMPDCDSTTVYSASIEWSCASGPVKKGSVRLNDSSCESRDPSSLMNVPPNAYSRTLGMHQAVDEVLERTSL